ncbi:hypothetical protein EJ03DRAFT_166885 [Teratosphaeria nubilosa]|uniref:Uncharacterized protein n=1 Tax=Teratosphaeria nubilosa TaxID=161662 RepID=A0A6G1L2K1_9PEZI|nr:hypothetical protein EJ03DRAFT_166885 [Teratosphaeria nubilosa]
MLSPVPSEQRSLCPRSPESNKLEAHVERPSNANPDTISASLEALKDTGHVRASLEFLYHEVHDAVEGFCEALCIDRQLPSPFCWQPSEGLARLDERCSGPTWGHRYASFNITLSASFRHPDGIIASGSIPQHFELAISLPFVASVGARISTTGYSTTFLLKISLKQSDGFCQAPQKIPRARLPATSRNSEIPSPTSGFTKRKKLSQPSVRTSKLCNPELI